MTRRIHVRRRLVSPGCPAWFATVTGDRACITGAYETQPAALAGVPELIAIMDAPPRETAHRTEAWGS